MPQEDEVFPAEEKLLPSLPHPQDDEDDDEVDIEADDDEEEEEHPAPCDSVCLLYQLLIRPICGGDTAFETMISSPVRCYSFTPLYSPIRPLGYQATMIRLRAEAASTSYSLLLPSPIILSHTIPAAPLSGTPPLHLLSTDRREDRPEVGDRHDLERDVGYGITESSDEIIEAMQGILIVIDVTELSQRMTEFETRVRRDTYKVYTRLDDEQSGRQLLDGRLNMLFRDRRAHAQVMSLCTTVLAQQSQIRELQSADRRRQTVITEMLAADHRRQKQLTEALKLIKRLQTQMAEFERQQGPAKGPAQPELPEEAERDANRSTNGDDSHNSGTSVRRTERAARECTYTDFLKCQPLNFKGTEGVAAVGTLILLLNMGSTHVRQLVIDAVTELALLCGRMFPKESDKIEKYVGGLPDMIYGSVVACKPKTMQDAVEIATELIDKKIRTLLNQKDVKCSVEDTSQDHSEPTTKKQEANTVDPFTARNWCQEAIRGI
ncbi:hypothetical protein Tco_0066922 [Tanacetum coccineum]